MDDPLDEYRSSLEDLTFNSKPHINVLTILAEENKDHAEKVVQLVEDRLYKVKIACFIFISYYLSNTYVILPINTLNPHVYFTWLLF